MAPLLLIPYPGDEKFYINLHELVARTCIKAVSKMFIRYRDEFNFWRITNDLKRECGELQKDLYFITPWYMMENKRLFQGERDSKNIVQGKYIIVGENDISICCSIALEKSVFKLAENRFVITKDFVGYVKIRNDKLEELIKMPDGTEIKNEYVGIEKIKESKLYEYRI